MTADQIEVCDALWREALAAGLVQWVPGMLTRWRWRVLRSAGSRCLAAPDDGGLCVWRGSHDWLVDWADPATRGCLLAVAREARGDASISVSIHAGVCGEWVVVGGYSMRVAAGDSEPEALLRAILATRGER